MTERKPPKTPASTKKKVAAASKKTKKTAADASASASAYAATVPKKKSTAAKANYSFDNTSAVQSHKTNHLTFFKCKINGVPRPQARAFPNAQHGQVNIHAQSKQIKKCLQMLSKLLSPRSINVCSQCLETMSLQSGSISTFHVPKKITTRIQVHTSGISLLLLLYS